MMAPRTKLSHDVRRALIVTTAVNVANDKGLITVNYTTVAKACAYPMASRTVWSFFRTKDELWKAVVHDHRVKPAVRKAAADMGLLPTLGA